MAVNHWPSSLHLGSSEFCEVIEFGQFLSRFWLSFTILYHPPKHSTFCTENVKGNRSIWILDLGECAAITRNLAYRFAQICRCCMVHRCRIAACSPFNPITLFCQMLNRCKMFKTCFCLCIPYTASGHHCFGHPRAWTPSWFIARTLMARYWTQILNRFPSFLLCFAKLDRQLFDALHHCQSTLERRLGILDSSMIMLQDRFALLRPGFVRFPLEEISWNRWQHDSHDALFLCEWRKRQAPCSDSKAKVSQEILLNHHNRYHTEYTAIFLTALTLEGFSKKTEGNGGWEYPVALMD